MTTFSSWSKAIDGAPPVVAGGSVPVAVSRESFPEDMLEHGWSNLADVLGMDGRSRYLHGKNSVGISIAIICAGIIARDISKAEMLLYKLRAGTRGYDIVAPTAHPIARMLRLRPHPEFNWTWPEMLQMQVLHLKLVSNCYWLKDGFRADGTFDGLLPIQPARIRQRVSSSGRIFYEIFTGTEFEVAALGKNYEIVPAERVIHIRNRMMDGVYGMSSMALGNPIFDLISSIQAYQNDLFSGDGESPLVFEMDQAFNDDAAGEAAFRRIKNQLTARLKKSRATGDPILLEAGIKAKSVANKSKENETTDSFNQQVMRVCGLMDCPPHKIFALEGVAYNNADAMNRAYYSDSLEPIATLLQEAFRLNLFSDDEALIYSPEFDKVKLMASDLPTLTKLVDMMMKNGAMTFDEAREVTPLRFGRLENGDRRMVPANMYILGNDGEIIPPPKAPTADPAADPNADPADDTSGDPPPADPAKAINHPLQ